MSPDFQAVAPAAPASGLVVDESPISRYLGLQQKLDTPIARFSQQHETLDGAGVARFSTLIPTDTPGLNQQYAFEVDLDRCSGCKACVSACHSMNGLRENEAWRDVGLIHGGSVAAPYQQTVTTACHHCMDPGCLNGCPVLAYDKDPVTGIVRHLDDQCIGCQYCVLKCPYDVPKYSNDLGIVRKCDMCSQRLSNGEAPACVQACPTEAIRIVIANTEISIADAEEGKFLPGAPDPKITVPTTRYKGDRAIPENADSVDRSQLRVEHTHFPLVLMLTLAQGGVGAWWFDGLLRWAGLSKGVASSWLVVSGLFLFFAGLGASVLHLGRPLAAWRAFLGWRRSWLSREILAFGLLAPLALGYGVAGFVEFGPWGRIAALGVWFVGPLSIFSSVMVYVDTQRVSWRMSRTAVKFFSTSLVIGGAAVLLVGVLGGMHAWMVSGIAFLVVSLIGKLAWEWSILSRDQALENDDGKTARVTLGPLLSWWRMRFSVPIVGACLLMLASQLDWQAVRVAMAGFGFIAVWIGEVYERSLFFAATSTPRMPGGIGR